MSSGSYRGTVDQSMRSSNLMASQFISGMLKGLTFSPLLVEEVPGVGQPDVLVLALALISTIFVTAKSRT